MSRKLVDKNISLFLQALAAETGASKNTLSAYESDLIIADNYIQAFFKTNLSFADEHELTSCLAFWKKEGQSPKTILRRISALKNMMKWLVSDGYREDNPATWLDSPKLPKSIPTSLSEPEIITLLPHLLIIRELAELSLRGISMTFIKRVNEFRVIRKEKSSANKKKKTDLYIKFYQKLTDIINSFFV